MTMPIEGVQTGFLFRVRVEKTGYGGNIIPVGGEIGPSVMPNMIMIPVFAPPGATKIYLVVNSDDYGGLNGGNGIFFTLEDARREFFRRARDDHLADDIVLFSQISHVNE